MSDIFDRITAGFLNEKKASVHPQARSLANRYIQASKVQTLASKVADKHASLTQPLMNRRDYGVVETDKSAADFLGTMEPTSEMWADEMWADELEADDFMADNAVQVNTGYDSGLDFTGPGNVEDELIACGESWGDEIIEDDLTGFEMMGEEIESELIKHSRYSEGEKGSKEYESAKKKGLVPDEFLEYEGAYDPKSGEMNMSRIEQNKKDMGKSAYRKDRLACGYTGEEEIIDDLDMGLEHMAGGDDHEHGSYMSIQNLHEMEDQLDMLTDSLEEDADLDDWVEDKISHAHAALSDVSRFIGYGHGHHGDEEGYGDEVLIIDDLSNMGRTASIRGAKEAGGLFGYPKAVQRDVETAIRKLENRVEQIARAVETKHPEAGTYFTNRNEASGCSAAKALAKPCVFNKTPSRVLSGGLGFKPACVKACHKAIGDVLLYSGEVSHGLFVKPRDYVPFIQTYAKKKKCPYAKLLLETMPLKPTVEPTVEPTI